MPDENQIIEPLREQAARNEEAGFPHPVVHLASAEAAVREGFAAGRAAATPDPPDDEGWSPGIDDPEPRALGDIDTGEGWYQT